MCFLSTYALKSVQIPIEKQRAALADLGLQGKVILTSEMNEEDIWMES